MLIHYVIFSMPKKLPVKPSDIRGLNNLTIETIIAVTNLVETVHSSISLTKSNKEYRKGGISGFVYWVIRTITKLVGGGVDRVLAQLEKQLENESIIQSYMSSTVNESEYLEQDDLIYSKEVMSIQEKKSFESYKKNKKEIRAELIRRNVIAALNGVLGDYLAERANPLALEMSVESITNIPSSLDIRREADELIQDENVNGNNIKPNFKSSIHQDLEHTKSDTFLLCIHGLCMNSDQWYRKGHHHGYSLEAEFGYELLTVDYNSGKHISLNGKELDTKLEAFFSRVDENKTLFVLAHSMGGLVIRSAAEYAKRNNSKWLKRLKKIVFLGTPHHGAPLEVGGNWIDTALDFNRYTRPFAKIGKIRSAGITDLRYGNLLDDDWLYTDRFNRSHDPRNPVPLPEQIRCYAIAGSISADENIISKTLIGDGLVPINSAFGESKMERHQLNFDTDNCYTAMGVSHLDLLCNKSVFKKISEWFREETVIG